jgi:hypothetical protein
LPNSPESGSVEVFIPLCGTSKREVDMIMRPAGKPRLDLRRLVSGIVIHDDMDIEHFGDLSIDLPEEV